VGPEGVTIDSRGRAVPWQRGGSHSPYIPDGTGTKGWASEYEREFQPHHAGNKAVENDGPGGRGKVHYDGEKRLNPADKAFYGLSYGRRLRDEGILPST